MPREPWTRPLGADGSFTHDIRDSAGDVIGNTAFLGTEPILPTVWPGGALQALPGVLSSAWHQPFDGTVDTRISGVTTAGLTPGFFRVLINVQSAGATLPIFDGWLKLTAVAAARVFGPVYATFSDVLAFGGDWIEGLITESGESGFQYELETARMWLDEAIVGKFRVLSYRYGPQYWVQLGTWPWGPPDAPDRTITQYLKENLLIVPPRDQAVMITAHKALAGIAAKKVDFSQDSEKFRIRRNYHNTMAQNGFSSLRALIDLNGDGYADLAINCGVISTR